MVLTDRQNDALAELINIAFSRTGAALSELTGQRVLLSPPSVSIHRTTDLPVALARYIPGEVATRVPNDPAQRLSPPLSRNGRS